MHCHWLFHPNVWVHGNSSRVPSQFSPLSDYRVTSRSDVSYRCRNSVWHPLLTWPTDQRWVPSSWTTPRWHPSSTHIRLSRLPSHWRQATGNSREGRAGKPSRAAVGNAWSERSMVESLLSHKLYTCSSQLQYIGSQSRSLIALGAANLRVHCKSKFASEFSKFLSSKQRQIFVLSLRIRRVRRPAHLSSFFKSKRPPQTAD